MKRIFSVLLIALLLCGCGKSKKEETKPTEPKPTKPAATEPSEPTEPTEPEVTEYRHPLTGEVLEKVWAGRPVAVVIPNNKDVYPHHGTGNADILYEIEAEGGVTRCLAIFSDLTGIEKLGPVRSARTYFNNVAFSYNAPIAHCGGSPGGISGRYDSSNGEKIPGWPHIDEMQNGQYFFRDTDRYNYQGYLWEYTLFTTGEKLQKAMEAREYTAEVLNYGWTFGDIASTVDGENAEQVIMKFRGDKKTIFNYADGAYEMIQHGDVYTDGNTNEKVTFRNVLFLQAEQWYDGDGYRTYYDLIGSGTGYYACDGKIIPIKWERAKLEDSFKYTLEDGTPVTLGVGTSYVAIAGQKGTIEYQ